MRAAFSRVQYVPVYRYYGEVQFLKHQYFRLPAARERTVLQLQMLYVHSLRTEFYTRRNSRLPVVNYARLPILQPESEPTALGPADQGLVSVIRPCLQIVDVLQWSISPPSVDSWCWRW